MKQIPLTQGQFAIVDDAVFNFVSQWKWHAKFDRHTSTYYASRGSLKNEGFVPRRTIRLHNAVWNFLNGPIPEGYTLDHISRDSLDNRIENLRLATRREQKLNQRVYRRNTSGYRGVSWHRRFSKWQARAMIDGEEYPLGRFACEVEAALARDAFLYRNYPSPFNEYNVL